jgi:adenosylcobinamide-phosphate synthase
MASWLFVQISVLLIALLFDVFIGEPPEGMHPVVWMGQIVAALEGYLYKGKARAQRLKGTGVAVALVLTFTVPVFFFEVLAYPIANTNAILLLLYVGLSAYLLKSSFTIFSLKKEALAVTDLAYNDIKAARYRLRALVSRDCEGLDRERILSGVCESIGENTIDSIVSPLLFFAFFGVAGALCYRAVNTLDSMLGYTDHREHAGLFSARLDDVFNYVPTRVAVVPMLLAFYAVSGRKACMDGWNVLKRDRRKKRAINSGIPVALFAGGLGVRFIKPANYEIGEGREVLTQNTVSRAVSAMLVTSIITLALVVAVLAGRTYV